MKKERSREKNLLFVLHSIEILLSSGKSIEESISIIAKNNYGAISVDFKEIITKTKTNNKSMHSALVEARQQTKVQNYMIFLEYLAFSIQNKVNILDNILNVEKKEEKEQIIMHKKYEKLAVNLMDVFLIVLIPPIILNMFIISMKIFGNSGLFSYFGRATPEISYTTMLAFYIVNSAALVGIAYYVYQANPSNR